VGHISNSLARLTRKALILSMSAAAAACDTVSGPSRPATHATSVDFTGYYDCLRSETSSRMANVFEEKHGLVPVSDVDGIGDSALAFCSWKFTNGKLVESYDQQYARTSTQEEWNKLESAKMDREDPQKREQQDLDEPKLKSEYDKAMVDYVRCLLDHTKLLV
jgi:hypothetical protein